MIVLSWHVIVVDGTCHRDVILLEKLQILTISLLIDVLVLRLVITREEVVGLEDWILITLIILVTLYVVALIIKRWALANIIVFIVALVVIWSKQA